MDAIQILKGAVPKRSAEPGTPVKAPKPQKQKNPKGRKQ
jgi:hypothetical protein